MRHENLNKAFKEKLQKDKEELAEKAARLDKELQNAQQLLKDRDEIKDSETGGLEKLLDQATEERSQLLKEKERLEKRVKAFEQDLKETSDEKEARIRDLREQVADLTEDNAILEKNLDKIRLSSTRSQGDKLEKVEKDKMKLEKDLKKVERERDTLEETVKGLEIRVREVSKSEMREKAKAVEEIEHVKRELNKLETKLQVSGNRVCRDNTYLEWILNRKGNMRPR